MNPTNLFDGLYGYQGYLVQSDVSTSFTGTGDTLRLTVKETPESGDNGNAFLVDNSNVTLTLAPPSVPEPSSLIVAAGTISLGVLGLLRKRRCFVPQS